MPTGNGGQGGRRVRTRVLLAAALLALAACERSEKHKATSAPAAKAPAAAPMAAATGDLTIEVRDGRVTIQCTEQPRGLVLERLGREVGFELVGDLDSQ